MISAFGVDHGEISKYQITVSPEVKQKRRAISQSTGRRSNVIWGGTAVGTGAAALVGKPKLAGAAVLGGAAALTANIANAHHKSVKQGLMPKQQPRVPGT